MEGLSHLYIGFASCVVGIGDTSFLWKDISNGNIMMGLYSELHSFDLNDTISIQQAMHITGKIYDLLQLPLSIEAHKNLLT